MPWDDDDQEKNKKGPWGQEPWGNGSQGKRPSAPQNPDIDVLIQKMQKKVTNIFGGGGGSGGKKNGALPNKSVAIVMVSIALLLWLASGVYTVNTKEEGVVLRFGKYVETTSPGLNYHWPVPIEKVIKISVTDRYKTEIGQISNPSRGRYSRDSSSSREMLMLTGDENIIDVNCEVQWQISDANKFLFNVYDPQTTVRDAAESALREVIGTTPLNDILSEGRTAAQLDTKILLQEIMDSYDIGIRIEEVNMRGVPPRSSIRVESITANEDGVLATESITTTVDEAFKDVQAAIINKQEIINTALARSKEVIPVARGHAQKLLQEAQGYKEQVVAKSEGEAKIFLSVYNEYRKAKEVTRKRIYLETMEGIFKGMDKIVLDTSGTGGVVPYLPLKELEKK